MQTGDTWYNEHTGLQERKTVQGVVLEIADTNVWRNFKAAQERNLQQRIADPPLAPQARIRQAHQKQPSQP